MESSQGHPKRLIITQMVLENFKSYAGAQRVGPFHKCFSSVVGPNGSGKSNVIDAMLFVFGKRAKQLRLNKVSELIHNSTHHQNLEQAKVSVYFQEIIDTSDEGYEVVPNSQLCIARTAMRNNSSNYYVDDKKSNFTEVTRLLKAKGVDLDNNRFLILQGEVEQISMMKPKSPSPHETGLLEYLEDIIGTDKYVELLEEKSKKLEELNEGRQSMVQRVKVVEKERDGLEGEKATAEAYMAKDRERLQCQGLMFQTWIHRGQRNLDTIERNLTELEAKLKHEQDKFRDYNRDLKTAEERYKGADGERGGIQSRLDACHEEFKAFERKDIKFREDLKHCRAKLKKTQDKLAKDTKKMESMGAEAQALERRVPHMETEIEGMVGKLRNDEQALEEMLEGLKGEVEAHRVALQGVRAQLAPWEKQLQEVAARVNVATAERDLLQKKQADACQRLQDAKAGVATANSSAAAKEADIKKMEAAVEKHRAEVAAARQQQAEASGEVERLEGALREVRGKVEQRRADASAQSSQGAVVKALLAAKAAGQLPGIHGRLGDLGAIDAKYDVAVSTACGALDFIVVDTTSTAQRCVELLRQRQLGVATFLILEQQQHLARSMQEKPTPPEGVPRLFDLVRVRDENLRVAFYYALRDTVVAGDLEQASRIAYGREQRWKRVVTLKGEMINESGTMSGGGGKPRGGRMCLGTAAPRTLDTKAAAAELATAEKEMNASAEALKAARGAAEAAAAAVRAAERALGQLEVAIPKARMEAEAQRALAQDLLQRLAQLEAATQVAVEDAKRLKALQATIKGEEAEAKRLQASASGLQEQAAELQRAIDNVGGLPLKQQKDMVAKLQQAIATKEGELTKAKAIATKEGELTKAKVQISASAKQAEKLGREVGKAEKERERLEADALAKEEQFKELEDAAFKVLQDVKQTEGLLAEKEEVLATIRAEFERKQKEVNIIRTVEVELENTVKDQRDKQEEEKGKLKHWRAKLKDCQKQLATGQREGEAPAVLTDEQLAADHDDQDLQYRITLLEEEMARMNPDMSTIEAYRVKDADYQARCAELEAATQQRDEVRREYEELRKRRLDEFMAGFNAISLKLKEMYQMITLGGDAELELVDSLDPFSEGIVFSVRPPKKSWKNIANLSGGEKTLSSLSLVFALHHYKPTPLYVMDEIDAALDFKNVSIVAHYIKERTKNAQFVIISLRNNMFELADRLVGIYKTDNATKSVAVNPAEFVVGRAKGAATAVSAQDQEQQPPLVVAAS
ncbi:hypothetical protein WJX72_003379 [[Myrmecia] bisecta]|uniref:Structural maintenance of chromosomes protein n=1 Tax=[Myrmecia] bisecta TaxID=41462 RepID=A0AAW1R5T1_9CHLO